MVTKERLAEFEDKFKGEIKEKKALTPTQILYLVDKKDLPDMAHYLQYHPEFDESYYVMGIGSDERQLAGKFAYAPVINMLDSSGKRENFYVILKARLDKDNPEFPSVAQKLPAALWAEREVRDLLGFKPLDHPDLRRLIVPEDWPEGVYPLRKDHEYNASPPGELQNAYKEVPADTSTVPIGPYHMALDEPAHFRLFVKGEEIVDVDYRGFYSHRGIEKIGEGRLTYNQIFYIAERICGICGFQHSCAYAMAVENIAGVEIPARAQYIRTILLEIERIHSHLLWAGVACHLVGFDTGFMHAWRIREDPVMWLPERLTGNRKTYGMNVVGGVRRDFLDYRKKEILDKMKQLRKDVENLYSIVTSSDILIKRAKDVGVLPYKVAKDYGVVGPTARASGRNIDVRRDHKVFAYKHIDFDVPVYKEGDVLARVLVRLDEVLQSINIIEQAVDQMPEGDIFTPIGKLPAYQESLGYTEAHRGEVIHYVLTGTNNKVYRWKVRAPTYNNLPAVPEMLKGYRVADAPLIIASIDPCYACTERVQIVDVKTGKVKVLNEAEFNELSIEASERL